MVNINNVLSLYSFIKAGTNKHEPYTEKRPPTNWKWMEISRTYARNRKKYYFQYYFMQVPGTFFGMAFSRCFGIQRAVMLALYCCRGNYDELFHIGLYLLFHSPSDLFRCKSLLFLPFHISFLQQHSLFGVLSLCNFLQHHIFGWNAFYLVFVCVYVCALLPHHRGIRLKPHSTSLNRIVSGLLLCSWTCKITFNY